MAKNVFLDTCFIIHELEEGQEKRLEEFLKENNVFVTSFNHEELMHVTRDIHSIKKSLKRLLDSDAMKIFSVPVSPGNSEAEKEYVESIDAELLKLVPDPSDAVLIAAALKHNADVLTRDKHHIFKAVLENNLKDSGIQVYNDISTYLSDFK